MPLHAWKALAFAIVLSLLAASVAGASPAQPPGAVRLEPFRLPVGAVETLRADMVDQLQASHPAGTWAPMKMTLTDDHLALLGLPPAQVLRAQHYEQPTMVSRDGETTPVDLPALATVAGTGYVGIRPGAFLLIIGEDSISWCSMGHVVGAAGSYDISTAGHCGDVGQRATVLAAFGNAAGTLNPVLLDFGSFVTSTGGGPPGDDWAIINIASRYQSLVTPTMPVWGGPRGTYTKTGAVASVDYPGGTQVPKVYSRNDPLLAQAVVHYGHGTGIGTGGTPRAGGAIHWGSRHFMFFGAISHGDSGSAANTLTGDTVGATMEAAGIITHLWVDSTMSDGLGIMAGTRTTVIGTPSRGQLLPYPAPAPTLP